MSSNTLSYAQEQDEKHQKSCFRDHFVIPTRGELRRQTLLADPKDPKNSDDDELCTYFCGNSLGLQPKLTRKYFDQYLTTWATKGVFGHFKPISDSKLQPWLNVDDDVQEDMAKIVGAKTSEVAMMQTLTANIHLLFASFYKPTKERYKILIEAKAFPSDHYAIQSQIEHHGFDPKEAMILVSPESTEADIISTERVIQLIDEHAEQAAILWLPGIQFYSGQFFDMARITAHAQSKGILVGWDLAHAVANVPLQLHDWNVDFAAWCTYKYMNCGPGAIGGLFVHEKHANRPRLTGWWGSMKSSRFDMINEIDLIPGAAGFQLSNPSVADLTSVRASLDIFKQTSMAALRERSLLLTGYLKSLLDKSTARELYSMITPSQSEEHGAQISVKLKAGLLHNVLADLEANGIVVDERKPDVIRVAPAPLYNNFQDVNRFVEVFSKACLDAVQQSSGQATSITADGGAEAKGWSVIK